MHRKERPLIRPRDISSLSRSVNANLESLLDRSRMTPVGDNRLNIEDDLMPLLKRDKPHSICISSLKLSIIRGS